MMGIEDVAQFGVPEPPEPVECETCAYLVYDRDPACGICARMFRREMAKANEGATRHEPSTATLAHCAAAAIVDGDFYCEEWESFEERGPLYE